MPSDNLFPLRQRLGQNENTKDRAKGNFPPGSRLTNGPHHVKRKNLGPYREDEAGVSVTQRIGNLGNLKQIDKLKGF